MTPKISINLCVYNGERFLQETLVSISRQRFKEWELIVVNDASTDRSGEILAGYRTPDGQDMSIYTHEKNQGVGFSRQRALERSRAPWVAIIDQDDLWDHEKLDWQMVVSSQHPEAGLIYTDCMFIRSPRDEALFYQRELAHREDRKKRMARGPCRDAFSQGCFHRVPPVEDRPYEGLLRGRNFIPCCTAMFSRDKAMKVGGFSSSLRYVEDLDLWLRLVQAYPAQAIHIPLARWRLHDQNLGGMGVSGMTAETLRVLEVHRARLALTLRYARSGMMKQDRWASPFPVRLRWAMGWRRWQLRAKWGVQTLQEAI